MKYKHNVGDCVLLKDKTLAVVKGLAEGDYIVSSRWSHKEGKRAYKPGGVLRRVLEEDVVCNALAMDLTDCEGVRYKL